MTICHLATGPIAPGPPSNVPFNDHVRNYSGAYLSRLVRRPVSVSAIANLFSPATFAGEGGPHHDVAGRWSRPGHHGASTCRSACAYLLWRERRGRFV